MCAEAYSVVMDQLVPVNDNSFYSTSNNNDDDDESVGHVIDIDTERGLKFSLHLLHSLSHKCPWLLVK